MKALLDEPVVIEPGSVLIPTGIALSCRSAMKRKCGLAAAGGEIRPDGAASGTIDSDYRGEITVILINHGSEPAIVQNGDRIAQLVIAPVVQASFSLTMS